MLNAGLASIRSFRVVPNLPEPLRPLAEIAHNLWWTWHPEAVQLFIRIDRDLWESTNHNPVKLLGEVDQQKLERLAHDQSFTHAVNRVHQHLQWHMDRLSWFQRQHPEATEGRGSDTPMRIAYFSAEFGLTECLQIYSGGLGGLAGDHLKSASELGVPLCGVGLLYRTGYFHQYLNADGWQQETYPEIDFPNQPVRRLIDPDTGEQYRVKVQFPGREVTIGVWLLNVGRVPLYLLDTNFPENQREDREITAKLYGGDLELRIQQEIVLGIGGVRVLEKVGERPTVYHINEGHAAFLGLERICRLRQEHGVGFDHALQAAAAGNLFTTHTPVPAGIDRFPPEFIERYFSHMLDGLGIDSHGLLALGRTNGGDHAEFFSMAVLALRMSQFCNGVSKLHGQVSREMWQDLWPGVPSDEIPIRHVTNGVHPRSWISPQLISLYDNYLGPEWQLDPTDYAIWEGLKDIPDEELWRVHRRKREKLISWCRNRIRTQLTRRGAGQEEIERSASALDPDIFTIGFARRFATYKRGTMLMRDLDRLKALFNNAERPVQLLIAGKAHPADGPGKELIRELVKFASETDHLNRIIFLEDYDIEVARRLVQGCDAWLNTPRRGMEASGTSGMKAAMNGVVNISVLDGWWDEAYTSTVGFAIGKGETYDDQDMQDAIESRALYDLLERVVLPEFYDRDASDLPRRWIARMKECIRQLTPAFSTNRMLADYAEGFYLPANALSQKLHAQGLKEAGELSAHIQRFRELWGGVSVEQIDSQITGAVPIGRPITVRADVRLGGLLPEEVSVQLYHGTVTSLGDVIDGAVVDMSYDPDAEMNEGISAFVGCFEPGTSGRRGFTVRVMPKDERLVGSLIPHLVTWFKDQAPGVTEAAKRNRSRREPITT